MPVTLPGIAAGAAAMGRQISHGVKTAGHMLKGANVHPQLMQMMMRLKHFQPTGLASMLTRPNLFSWTTPPPRFGTMPGGGANRPPPLPPRRQNPLQARFRAEQQAQAKASSQAMPVPEVEEPPDEEELAARRAATSQASAHDDLVIEELDEEEARQHEASKAQVRPPPRDDDHAAASQQLIRRPPRDDDHAPASQQLIRRPPGAVGSVLPQNEPKPGPARPSPHHGAHMSPLLNLAMHKVDTALVDAHLPPALAQMMRDVIGPRLHALNDMLGPTLAPFDKLWTATHTGESEHWLADAGRHNAMSLLDAQPAPGHDPHHHDAFHPGAPR